MGSAQVFAHGLDSLLTVQRAKEPAETPAVLRVSNPDIIAITALELD